ncbi:MAG: ATP-binding cassette domain-containing protein, partial [Microbacteriaceae bacterium]|nr:ATP-binding cassette domain-containing protein [Microbacteriaceae bacterium]
LDFLGLGDIRVPTWGMMLSEAFVNIYLNPQLLIWPGVAISATIASLAIFANALRDALEDEQKTATPARKSTPTAQLRTVSARGDDCEKTAGADRVLTVSQLGVGYRQDDGTIKTVVDNVSLHVDRGEVLGIVGESGSGKSQTAFSVLGLLPNTAIVTNGQIRLHGTDLLSRDGESVSQKAMLPLRGKRIAYIPQEPMSNLDPAFTVGHQLVRPMRKVLKISVKEARNRALELLRSVGITDPARIFDSYPHQISGGMAQRVLIAGAVSCEPELLIADEPTTALDVTVQAEVLDVLRDLQRERHMAVVLVTHNFGVVADICDRVAVMQNGRLVEQGAVADILQRPEHPYTQSLLAATLEGKPPMTMLNIENER